MEEKQGKIIGQPTLEQQKLIESMAIEKSEKGDRDYRKKYRKTAGPVSCIDCGKIYTTLRTLPEPQSQSSFKRPGSKYNRNRKVLKDNNGNVVYMCNACIEKRAKGENK